MADTLLLLLSEISVCIYANPHRAAEKKNSNFGGDNWSEMGWEETQLPALSRNTYAGTLQGNL